MLRYYVITHIEICKSDRIYIFFLWLQMSMWIIIYNMYIYKFMKYVYLVYESLKKEQTAKSTA